MEQLRKRGVKGSGYYVIVFKGKRPVWSTSEDTRHKAVASASKLRRGVAPSIVLKMLPSTYEVVVRRKVDREEIYRASSVRSYLLRKRFTESIKSTAES